MIHRRILDVAASDPDASMEAIADEVSGASPALVERVLDEYGDPGLEDDPGEGHDDAIGSPDADGTAGQVIADGASEDISDLDDSDAGADDGEATDDTATDDTKPVDTEPTDDTATDDTKPVDTEPTDDTGPTADGDDATVGDAATDEATTDTGTTTDGGTAGLNVATSVGDIPVADEAASADDTASATDTASADDSSTGDDPSTANDAPTTDDTAPATTDDTASANTTERDDDTLIRGGVGSEGFAAKDETAGPDDGAATEDDGPHRPPEIESLSDKQRRTLRALYERPSASQGDLADELDVTRATVCRRLNAIPGFEWSDRRAFAESVFGDEADAPDDGGVTAIQSTTPENDGGPGPVDDGSDTGSTDSGDADRGGESARSATRRNSKSGSGSENAGPDEADASPGIIDRRLAAVEDRLAMIESRLDDTGAEEGTALSLSPELAHKVVHACMESDTLSEEEELEVLRALME